MASFDDVVIISGCRTPWENFKVASRRFHRAATRCHRGA